MIIALLGRQPKLGLAELESIYGAQHVQPLGLQAAKIDVPHVDHKILGGSIRLAKPLAELSTTNWDKIAAEIARQLPHFLAGIPEGKIKLGLSVFDVRTTPQQLFRTGLELKKVCRANQRSVRVMPNATLELNSAQVLHNQLTGPLGMELLCIADGNKTWLAQTNSIQDVDDYARRDQARPHRDAFVGMLPPKLAQIMLNLANVQPDAQVLDPFCGTGVLLQEAALRGFSVYGTDINERMIDYTRDNLAWLKNAYHIDFTEVYEVADATNARWKKPLGTVVCETYLGQPLSGLPKPEKLREIMQDCNTIIGKFLRNLRPQLQKGTRLCIAVPAWRIPTGFKHLALLDDLENIGYNRLRFEYATRGDLVYHREGQIVARELLVITVI